MEIHEMGELFSEVQMKNVLGDGKTFPDCIPNLPLADINAEFQIKKADPNFDLKQFVSRHFKLPKAFTKEFKSDPLKSPVAHINNLWDFLTRHPGEQEGSLIPLPRPYVVPGGRFREIYYWDSYFTMLGLKVSGRDAAS